MPLYFVNQAANTVWVAFAYYDTGCGEANQNFRKQGWWQITSGQTFNAWNTDLSTVNRYAYFYAESADGATWAGTGNAWLYITQNAFNQCAFDNTNTTSQVDFIQLDFSGDYGLYVYLGPEDSKWTSSVQAPPHSDHHDHSDIWGGGDFADADFFDSFGDV